MKVARSDYKTSRGSRLIEVEYVDGKPKIGSLLIEKEKAKLREFGKITEDVAPPYRLACQFIAPRRKNAPDRPGASALPPVSRETRLTGFAANGTF